MCESFQSGLPIFSSGTEGLIVGIQTRLPSSQRIHTLSITRELI